MAQVMMDLMDPVDTTHVGQAAWDALCWKLYPIRNNHDYYGAMSYGAFPRVITDDNP